MSEKNDIRVCVIGAGVCGIVSIKECLDAGFEVTCFEKSSCIGGLWNYNDRHQSNLNDDGSFTPSVMKTTILNTGKEISAFSDFPPPSRLPNFMRHNLYMNYIRSYSEHFKVIDHIKFEHEVVSCKPEYNQETDTVSWKLLILNRKANENAFHTFDKLLVANGHHNSPFVPIFSGQDKYKGKIIHTVNIKNVFNDERFKNKKVIVIGSRNSAFDVATDLSVIAERVYISTYRTNWIISRLMPYGPYDQDISRKNNYIKKIIPSYVEASTTSYLKSLVNYDLLGLTPMHKPAQGLYNVNEQIPVRILTGDIVLKGPISRFVEEGVVFEDDDNRALEADVVVLATGYKSESKFFDEIGLGIKSIDQTEYDLFLNMYAANLTISNLSEESIRKVVKSFAFIGHISPQGSIGSVSELQARYASLVFRDIVDLPSICKMIKTMKLVKKKNLKLALTGRQLVNSYINYCDDIARRIDVNPKLLKLFFTDHALWKKLVYGPSVPYQYRLRGPNKWDEAREVIMKVEERVKDGINEGKSELLIKNRRKMLAKKSA